MNKQVCSNKDQHLELSF